MSSSQRTHATPTDFTNLVADYYQHKATYHEQYNTFLNNQPLTTTLPIMPSHPAEVCYVGYVGLHALMA